MSIEFKIIARLSLPIIFCNPIGCSWQCQRMKTDEPRQTNEAWLCLSADCHWTRRCFAATKAGRTTAVELQKINLSEFLLPEPVHCLLVVHKSRRTILMSGLETNGKHGNSNKADIVRQADGRSHAINPLWGGQREWQRQTFQRASNSIHAPRRFPSPNTIKAKQKKIIIFYKSLSIHLISIIN